MSNVIKDATMERLDLITATATKATYATAGAVTIFGMSVDIFVAISGLILGLATLLVNAYFKHQKNKMESSFRERELALRAQEIKLSQHDR